MINRLRRTKLNILNKKYVKIKNEQLVINCKLNKILSKQLYKKSFNIFDDFMFCMLCGFIFLTFISLILYMIDGVSRNKS